MEQKRRGRPRKMPEQVVDWEALAKNLQLALEREIDDNEKLNKQKDKLAEDILKLFGVIHYLESKIGNPKL